MSDTVISPYSVLEKLFAEDDASPTPITNEQ
jgi:hypothetical protein